jgi:glutamate formiminotransferase/formiminotetrahydrofolate cyclodeaminase
MIKLVECVPNFSEGRDKRKIDEIISSMNDNSKITILDVDMGFDTNRTVITIVGSPDNIIEAAYHGIKKASEIIDMRKHSGTHPRLGATDVCPLIPISNVSDNECIQLSFKLAKRLGEELKLPVYLYEKSAKKSYRSKLPVIRKGEFEGLEKKINDKDWAPDFGPREIHKYAGASVIGCRDFLIAYNINLNTKDHRLATDIAFELREAGRSQRIKNPESNNLLDGEIVRDKHGKAIKVEGKYKDVKGIGWYVGEFNRAQISINFNNYKLSTIYDVYDEACKLAIERGLRVTGSELVGLIPKDALIAAGVHYLNKQKRSIGVPESDIIECAVQSLGLNDVTEFDKSKKIIEYAVQNEKRTLISLRSEDLIKELSRNSPAPGGGSVSALLGAYGSALSSMVAALSYEKKELFKNRKVLNQLGLEAQVLKDKLSWLVDEDTISFSRVMKANRLPSLTNEEKHKKSRDILNANKYALEVPLETAKNCLKMLEIIEKLIKNCNINSISDVGVASEASYAGLRGGCMNVLINLVSIKDGIYCKSKEDEVRGLLSKAEKLHSENYIEIMNLIIA